MAGRSLHPHSVGTGLHGFLAIGPAWEGEFLVLLFPESFKESPANMHWASHLGS